MVITFHENSFANPAGLVAFIGRQPVGVRLRPDHTLVVKRDWRGAEARLEGVREILGELVEIASAGA